MKSADDIKNTVRNIRFSPNPDVSERILEKTEQALKQKTRDAESNKLKHNMWRIIMKKRTRRLTSIAAAVVIVALGIFVADKLTTPAWAIDQAIEALDKVSNITVSGTTIYYDENDNAISLPFESWVKLDDKDGNLFVRVESDREFAIVRDETVYFRNPKTNEVKILEGENVQNLQFWYKVMDSNPWFTGKMLKMLNSIASDWEETYGIDERTGRKSVFVNCSYEKLQASFWFVFDVETKLIVEAKHWMNTGRQGPPNLHATSFEYNKDLPDDMFEFETPEGAKTVPASPSEK